jgi:hypothetical protein
MQEATSFKQIRDVIKGVIDEVENQKYTEEGFANPYNLNQNSLTFLKNLNLTENELAGMSIDAVLKVKKTTETQKHHTNNILNSIVRNLTPNMRTLLQFRANQLGTDVPTVLLEYVSSSLKDERSITLDVQSSLDSNGKLKKTGKDGKDDSMKDLKPMTAYQTGKGGVSTKITLVPGSSTFMSSTGMSFGAPLDAEGKSIGETSLQDFLNKGFGTIGMVDKGLYFGDQRISPDKFSNVLVDGLGLYRVFLPYAVDEFGAMKPNFNLYNKFSIFEKEVLKDPSKVKELLQNPDFAEFSDYVEGVTPEGKIKWNNAKMAAFLMVGAEAGGSSGFFGGYSGVIDPDVSSNFITNIKSLGMDPENENVRFKNILKVEGGDDIFKGYMFIPLANNSSLALLADGMLEHSGNVSVEENALAERQNSNKARYKNNSSKLYN